MFPVGVTYPHALTDLPALFFAANIQQDMHDSDQIIIMYLSAIFTNRRAFLMSHTELLTVISNETGHSKRLLSTTVVSEVGVPK